MHRYIYFGAALLVTRMGSKSICGEHEKSSELIRFRKKYDHINREINNGGSLQDACLRANSRPGIAVMVAAHVGDEKVTDLEAFLSALKANEAKAAT